MLECGIELDERLANMTNLSRVAQVCEIGATFESLGIEDIPADYTSKKRKVRFVVVGMLYTIFTLTTLTVDHHQLSYTPARCF